jgi:hypothetical protein
MAMVCWKEGRDYNVEESVLETLPVNPEVLGGCLVLMRGRRLEVL